MQTNVAVVVQTVGLSSEERTELGNALAPHPEVQLQHHGQWNFSLLHADVIVLATDVGLGQETLEMLRYYGGAKRPTVVTLSESEEHLCTLGYCGGRPSFVSRLTHALRQAGCSNVNIAAAPYEPAAVEQLVIRMPASAVPESIRWRD